MPTRSKSINLFLMDGSPNGCIKCTLANWAGVSYKIPRTELDKCKDRDDLKQSGVYFLFGTSDRTVGSVVYIGQAGIRKNGEGILYRLKEHKRNPKVGIEYWTEAIVFTTSNNSFGATEISWLENYFFTLATKTRRYKVFNDNAPNRGNVTEEKESELEEFVDYAKVIMGVLGHKIFEPLTAGAIAVNDVHSNINMTDSIMLELKQGEAYAKGQRTSDGFVLLQGSCINLKIAQTCTKNAKKQRELHSSKVDVRGVLQEDILLHSPNEAAGFVTGYSINAREAWKTADGRTLKEIENSEVCEEDNIR